MRKQDLRIARLHSRAAFSRQLRALHATDATSSIVCRAVRGSIYRWLLHGKRAILGIHLIRFHFIPNAPFSCLLRRTADATAAKICLYWETIKLIGLISVRSLHAYTLLMSWTYSSLTHLYYDATHITAIIHLHILKTKGNVRGRGIEPEMTLHTSCLQMRAVVGIIHAFLPFCPIMQR